MFALLQAGRDSFDIDTMLHLFDCLISPILLYGSEIWGYCSIDIIERVHLRFCKILLKVHKSTPNNMVYGELGRYPLLLQVKVRMVSFWHRLVTNNHKIASICYKLMYQLHCMDDNVSQWLLFTKKILDDVGKSFIWLSQGQNISNDLLKLQVKQSLRDQFIQQWSSDIFTSSKCCNYRIFKCEFGFETYLTKLPIKLREFFTKFRCRNHKLPIEQGIYAGIAKDERLCTLCDLNEMGDEFHYLFNCTHFSLVRKTHLKKFYRYHVSSLKMKLLFNLCDVQCIKLCKFIKHIMQAMR